MRDGQQGIGCAIPASGRVPIGRALAAMGVDIIEAGFPISSPEELRAVRAIATEVREPIISAFGRCLSSDIEAMAQALEPAEKARMHLYLGSSKEHRGARKMSEQQMIDMAAEGVRMAKRHVDDVQYSPEDASRTPKELLVQIAKEVIKAGATTFNIPDTVGAISSPQMEQLFRYVYDNLPEVRDGKVVLSAHTHNDTGLALANAFAAVVGGARQVEGSFNGIGERTGNCATEQIINGIHQHGPSYAGPFGTPDISHIRREHTAKVSTIVSMYTRQKVSPFAPYTGNNAFATQSGTHLALILVDPTTYYVVDPAEVGREGHEISIGVMSGGKGVFHVLSQLGYDIPEEDQDRFFKAFKSFADSKRTEGGTVSTEELKRLAYEFFAFAIPAIDRSDRRFIASESNGDIRRAQVIVRTRQSVNHERREETWTGESDRKQGVFQAVAAMLREKTGRNFMVIDERQEAAGSGEEAGSRAIVVIEYNGKLFTGTATDTDIESSAVRALFNAVNQSYIPLKQS